MTDVEQHKPSVWRNAGFRRLFTAWASSNVADSALFLMAAVWVKELTGSDSAAALVLVSFGAPAVLAPVIGQLIDRFSRRRVLVLAHVSTALAVASLLLVTSPATAWLVYAVIFIYGAVGYVTSAAQSGLLRDLLPDEHLAPANGALSALDQALRLASPLIGTGVYAIWGPVPVILLTVVCFTAAALILQTVKVAESEPETSEERGTYWHEMSAGFRHLAATPGLGRLTLLLAVAIGATGIVNVSMFPVMEQGLQLPPATLGLLVAPQGIGGLLAGLTVAWLIARLGETRTFALGLVLLGVGILPLIGTNLTAAMVGGVVVGLGVTWTVVAFISLRQRLTPPRLQGRTSAATSIAINLPQTAVSVAGVGLLLLLDYRFMLVATTLTIVAGSLLAIAQTPARTEL
ncbi:MAG: MFS transporter [Ornithinimicrobium sp.]